MAKQERKAPISKPVTQHQLFPAVIALWFGALFGLGSLALRPSLIEELVIKSRIDLLIPAAAPPLGMTARMSIALVLAALGAMLGASIARRIARPKQEVRERKRTKLSTRDEGASNSAFNGFTDASTRSPGPSGGGPGEVAAPGVLAGRRRSLAIEDEVKDFVPHDAAPLPGGSPQIFDIAAAGLNEAYAAPIAQPEADSYSQPAPFPAPAPVPAAPQVALDWANAVPVLPPAKVITPAPDPQPIEAQRQVFHSAEPDIVLPASEDGRQVFGMTPPAIAPADQPRQIFGAPVTDDHVSKEFVEAHGFRTSVFEATEPSPLFAARAEAPLPAAIPEAYAPPAETAVFAITEAPVLAVAVPPAETTPEPELPSPALLGIEDLSARLAESMRRRRAGRAAAPAEIAVEPAALVVPEAFEPAVQPPHDEPEIPVFAVPAFTVPAFAVPPFTVPVEAEPAAAEAQAPQPVPAGLRPLDLAGFEEEDREEQDRLLPPRRIFLPVEVAPASDFTPPVTTPVAEETDVAEDLAVAEENYASLLAVTPSPVSLRNPFVRVDEPEAEIDAVEPVVIFPGQAMPAPQPIAPPAAIGVEEAVLFRRFDAPATAGQGQSSAANEAASTMPPEEAERALRSALANLQRMSGAA